MPPCSFHGCERQAKYAKTGWCQTHYHRWWRTGKVNGKKQERGASGKDAIDALRQHVIPDDAQKHVIDGGNTILLDRENPRIEIRIEPTP